MQTWKFNRFTLNIFFQCKILQLFNVLMYNLAALSQIVKSYNEKKWFYFVFSI